MTAALRVQNTEPATGTSAHLARTASADAALTAQAALNAAAQPSALSNLVEVLLDVLRVHATVYDRERLALALAQALDAR